MTTGQLMAPRYEVIADYPLQVASIGDIIEGERAILVYDTESGQQDVKPISKYPALFKLLQWWERREESNMPEYVKAFGKVYKVKDADEIFPDGFVIDHATTEEHVQYSCCLPATKQEYDQYIKSKEK